MKRRKKKLTLNRRKLCGHHVCLSVLTASHIADRAFRLVEVTPVKHVEPMTDSQGTLELKSVLFLIIHLQQQQLSSKAVFGGDCVKLSVCPI